MPSKEIIRHINKLIDQNQKEKAIEFIFEMIIKYADAKQFNRAEKLRERLIEIDSMALKQIIDSAEIIEREKSKLIDLNHKNIWAALYDGLTDEEANAFYFALHKARIQPAKKLIQQGKLNNKLFFVDHGMLKVVCSQKDHELFLKNISKGEISGQDTFFSVSVATASVISMDEVKLHFLEREKYSMLVEKFAGFDGKLEKFCKKLVKQEIADILKKKNIERRHQERYKISGKVAIQILDSKGQAAQNPFYGMLENLSEGGLSLSITGSSRETARSYLGRFVSLKMVSNKSSMKMAVKGIVLSVYNELFNNYSISLKFTQPVPLRKIKEFTNEN